jgi:hypothetical protein
MFDEGKHWSKNI